MKSSSMPRRAVTVAIRSTSGVRAIWLPKRAARRGTRGGTRTVPNRVRSTAFGTTAMLLSAMPDSAAMRIASVDETVA